MVVRKTILVGAAGSIGSQTIIELEKRGHTDMILFGAHSNSNATAIACFLVFTGQVGTLC